MKLRRAKMVPFFGPPGIHLVIPRFLLIVSSRLRYHLRMSGPPRATLSRVALVGRCYVYQPLRPTVRKNQVLLLPTYRHDCLRVNQFKWNLGQVYAHYKIGLVF